MKSKAILDKIVAVLSTVPNIHAIVLGGSRAGGGPVKGYV